MGPVGSECLWQLRFSPQVKADKNIEAVGPLYWPSRDTSACLHCYSIISLDFALAGTCFKAKNTIAAVIILLLQVQ